MLNRYLVICLVITLSACTAGKKLQSTKKVENETTVTNIPPTVPVARTYTGNGKLTLMATTGTVQGEISVDIGLTGFEGFTGKLEVRRVPGNLAPSEDCVSGSSVKTLNSPLQKTLIFNDATGALQDEMYSYRVCALKPDGDAEAQVFQTGVRAKDTTPPPPPLTFSANTGSGTGEIQIQMLLPADRTDYNSLEIHRLPGLVAPTCQQGSIIPVDFSGSSNIYITDVTGTTLGEKFSYRVCVWDRSQNLNSAGFVQGVMAKPAGTGSFSLSGSTGANIGDITLNFTYPSDIGAYNHIKIRRLPGSLLPNETCTDGTLLSIVLPPFPGSLSDTTGTTDGSIFSYRACVFNSLGAILATGAVSGIQAKPDLSVPVGAVIPFNGTSCPAGWAEFVSARGRSVVGLNSGGVLGATVGTALTNLENRATGAHTHTVAGVFSGALQSAQSGGDAPFIKSPVVGDRISNAMVGGVAGTNAPYAQYLFCKKVSGSAEGLLQNSLFYIDASNCPTGSNLQTSLNGRYITGLNTSGTLAATVGTALGNLENRPTGEHSHTLKAIALSGSSSGHDNPSDFNALTYPSSVSKTSSGVDGGAQPGTNAPYIQYPVCEKSVASAIVSGTILHFDLSSCPVGWVEITQSRGRYLVGLPNGGTLGGSVGNALSAQENRAAGEHSHVFATVMTGTISGGDDDPAQYTTLRVSSSSKKTFVDPAHIAGTNAPYVQLLNCRKN